MPSTQLTPSRLEPRAELDVPPLRGSRTDSLGIAESAPVEAEGVTLVAYDGGRAGRAALRHALARSAGAIGIVHLWTPIGPGGLAGAGVHREAGGLLLHFADENEQLRERAERTAGDAVASAHEHGRDAFAVVRPLYAGASRAAALASIVDETGADHLVLSAAPRTRWQRVLLGPGTATELASHPPCPCTVVPENKEASA